MLPPKTTAIKKAADESTADKPADKKKPDTAKNGTAAAKTKDNDTSKVSNRSTPREENTKPA